MPQIADLALLEDVLGASLALIGMWWGLVYCSVDRDVVGAADCKRRSERTTQTMHLDLVAVSKSSPPSRFLATGSSEI